MGNVHEVIRGEGYREINTDSISSDGRAAMESIKNALKDMRLAMAEGMNEVNDAAGGRNLFDV